jgi:hypothetical protein
MQLAMLEKKKAERLKAELEALKRKVKKRKKKKAERLEAELDL